MTTKQMARAGDLVGAEYNPREISNEMMEALIEGLDQFGLVQPIVVRRKDNLVIGGHQRLRAVRTRAERNKRDPDEERVWVEYVDLDDAKAKALNLALNKVHGDWDYTKLGELVQSLQDESAGLLDLTGFSRKEVDDLLELTVNDLGSLSDLGGGLDPDEQLEEDGRKFTFQVDTKKDAKLVTAVLTAYGMTGPKDAALAFVAVIKAAAAAQETSDKKKPASPAPVKGGKKPVAKTKRSA